MTGTRIHILWETLAAYIILVLMMATIFHAAITVITLIIYRSTILLQMPDISLCLTMLLPLYYLFSYLSLFLSSWWFSLLFNTNSEVQNAPRYSIFSMELAFWCVEA